MPPAQRRHATGVIDRLLAAPHQFGFFQAVRLLDGWLANDEQGRAGLSRVQFRNSLSLSFAASEIESLQVVGRPAQGHQDGLMLRSHRVDRVELTPAFMGLLGVSGTLPTYYTEALAQRELYQKDGAARAFMDIFSHRAVTLFYEAWTKHRLPIQFERDRRRHFLPLVLALAGLGQDGLRARGLVAHAIEGSGLPPPGARGAHGDEALAYFAGALQQRVRSARQLQAILASHLGVDVQVEQFVGRWCTLPPSGRFMLGRGAAGGGRQGKTLGAPGVLGRSATLGERVWQRDMRVRLQLGPLSAMQFRRLLPGSTGAAALRDWLTMLCGVSQEFEVRLCLQREAVQGLTLSGERAGGTGRLGWDSFLQTRAASSDRQDVAYTVHALG